MSDYSGLAAAANKVRHRASVLQDTAYAHNHGHPRFGDVGNNRILDNISADYSYSNDVGDDDRNGPNVPFQTAGTAEVAERNQIKKVIHIGEGEQYTLKPAPLGFPEGAFISDGKWAASDPGNFKFTANGYLKCIAPYKIDDAADGRNRLIFTTIELAYSIDGGDMRHSKLKIIFDNTDGSICGTDEADRLKGSPEKADIINGLLGNDILATYGKNDVVNGGGGDDRIFAGFGNDTIVFNGDAGDDTVAGGAGRDTYEFLNGVDSHVTITDFDRSEDKILIGGKRASPTDYGHFDAGQLILDISL